MTRRKSSESSSLELLLDTICNTFGGIVFLAILVAILLQMSGRSEKPTETARRQKELVDLQSEQETLTAELERLRKVVEEQDQMVAKLAPSATREDLEKVLAYRRSKSDLTKKQLEALGEINGSEIEIGKIAQDLQALDEALAKVRDQATRLEAELQAELKSRSAEAKLPMLRDTAKREVPVVLVGGRLSVLLRPGARGALNTDEFDVKDLGTGRGTVKPKPGAGTLVQLDGSSHDAIASRLAGFNKDRDYLAVFVWHNSFDHFRALRNVMVERGFEYRLVPIPPGQDAIREGSGKAQVQ